MATNIYESCANPVTGETFKALSHTPEAFTMLWMVQPQGYVPFEHIHYNQDEVFHVQKGEVRIVMNGKEYIGKTGNTLTVPKGKAHIAFNNKPEMLQCRVEYRPGLDHDKFMQCFIGLINDGFIDKKGGLDIPKMGYFLTKMNTKFMARPTSIPASVFSLALKIFYLRGKISGWQKLLDKYIGSTSPQPILSDPSN